MAEVRKKKIRLRIQTTKDGWETCAGRAAATWALSCSNLRPNINAYLHKDLQVTFVSTIWRLKKSK